MLCTIHFNLMRIFSPYFLHICESHHQKYHIVSRNFLSSPERPLVPVCTVLCSVIAFWHLSINRQRQDTRLESCNIWELGRDCLEFCVSLFNNRHILHIIFIGCTSNFYKIRKPYIPNHKNFWPSWTITNIILLQICGCWHRHQPGQLQDGSPTSNNRDHHGHPATQGNMLSINSCNHSYSQMMSWTADLQYPV